MTDVSRLLDERVVELLEKVHPGSASIEEFRGEQYDLGLASVHFPEGKGGWDLPPMLQSGVDARLEAEGAPRIGGRQFFGLTMAGPTVVTHGSEAHPGSFAAQSVHR
jgi:hypothetical protein